MVANKEHVGWHDDEGDGASISPRRCLAEEWYGSPYTISEWSQSYRDRNKNEQYKEQVKMSELNPQPRLWWNIKIQVNW